MRSEKVVRVDDLSGSTGSGARMIEKDEQESEYLTDKKSIK